jgi:hypothetical protein
MYSQRRAKARAESSYEMQPSTPSGAAAPSNTPAIAAEETAETVRRSASLAGDLLRGADEVAEFLYGDRKHRRRVYNLVEGNSLPIFRIGANICARKSILLDWIACQEQGNTRGSPTTR